MQQPADRTDVLRHHLGNAGHPAHLPETRLHAQKPGVRIRTELAGPGRHVQQPGLGHVKVQKHGCGL